jgi:thymidylate synthase
MYLGVELQKAEMALLMKEQFIYEQDKPVKLQLHQYSHL